MRYYINFGTGAGNEYVDGTLEDAKKVAQDRLAYTQTDVKIQTEGREDVAVLNWYGVKPEISIHTPHAGSDSKKTQIYI